MKCEFRYAGWGLLIWLVVGCGTTGGATKEKAVPVVRWVFQIEKQDGPTWWLGAPELGEDGTVYAAAEEVEGSFAGQLRREGAVYAITENGAEKWKFVGGRHERFCRPNADGGRVYATGTSGKLYALDSNGEIVWEYSFDGEVYPGFTGKPVVENEAIYFAARRRLYAVDRKGKAKWAMDIEGGIRAILKDKEHDTMYAYGDEKVYAIAHEGRQVWSCSIKGTINSISAGSKGRRVYIGTWTGQVIAVEEGEVLWRVQYSKEGVARVTRVSDGVIVVGRESVHRISSEGKVRWRWKLRGAAIDNSAAAVRADGRGYFVSEPRNGTNWKTVYAMSSEGEIRWMAVLESWVMDTPVLGRNGTVYVSTGGIVAMRDVVEGR